MEYIQDLIAGRNGNTVAFVIIIGFAIVYYHYIGPSLKEFAELKTKYSKLVEKSTSGANSPREMGELLKKFTALEETLRTHLIDTELSSIPPAQLEQAIENLALTEGNITGALERLNEDMRGISTALAEESKDIIRVVESMKADLQGDHRGVAGQLDALLRSLDFVTTATTDLRDKHSTLTGAVLGVDGLHQAQRIRE
jgi:ABC-type transporter Mla subunit MlaD